MMSVNLPEYILSLLKGIDLVTLSKHNQLQYGVLNVYDFIIKMLFYLVILLVQFLCFVQLRKRYKLSAKWNGVLGFVIIFVLLSQIVALHEKQNASTVHSLTSKGNQTTIDLRASDPVDVDYDVAAKSGQQVKVLLVTYMRSGSTFLGSMLRVNDKSQYWFEPIDGVYRSLYGTAGGILPLDITHYLNGSARGLPASEREYIVNTLVNIFRCHCDGIPHETLLHYYVHRHMRVPAYNACTKRAAFKAFNQSVSHASALGKSLPSRLTICPFQNVNDRLGTCRKWLLSNDQSNHTLKTQLEKFRLKKLIFSKTWHQCRTIFYARCNISGIRAVKAIRITMDIAQDVLLRDPQIKIVHLLRDPRGIASSRLTTGLYSKSTRFILTNKTGKARDWLQDDSNKNRLLATEAQMLCQRMSRDIEIGRQLKAKYPKQFTQLTYEAVALDPLKYYRALYDFLGLGYSQKVEDFIHKTTHAKADGQLWSVVRQNATETAFKWKTKLSETAISNITEVCDSVLKHMGPILSSLGM